LIDFLCPNGHRIRCPADQAGQVAKCPRCGVKFRVPSVEEAELGELSPGNADGGPAELISAAPGGSSDTQPRPPQKEPQIEFLCPNGHHLHGPASLQGRPGACPECGSRFRIPIVDEAQEGPAQVPAQAPSAIHGPAGGEETGSKAPKLARAAVAAPASTPSPSAVEIPAQADVAASLRAAASSKIVLGGPPSAHPPAAMGHPLAELVSQLWAAKGEQSKVELRLEGGDTLAVDYFVKGLSRGAHGVFGAKADDDNWTLTVVRWDAVVRVVLRDIKNLPTLFSDK
jgi:hypothetical protein